MRLASKGGVGFWEAQAFRLFRIRKRARQFFKYRPGGDKTVLLIAGCQRSGTTLLHHVLRRDPDTVTFDEVSPLSDPRDPERLRWKAKPEVARIIRSCRAPLVVAKPLVESQDLISWLDFLPGAHVVWMFRNFRDVARSNLAFFGPENGWNDLRPILDGRENDWRFQHLPAGVVATIRELAAGNPSPQDAAALFWYARNSLYFGRGLSQDERGILCRYEDLTAGPEKVIRSLYEWLGRAVPEASLVGDVAGRFVGQGRSLELSEPVERICAVLEARLMAAPRLASQ